MKSRDELGLLPPRIHDKEKPAPPPCVHQPKVELVGLGPGIFVCEHCHCLYVEI